MASFVPLKCSVTMRLNTGTHPETGKPVLKVISIRGIDPAVAANPLDATLALVKPFFVHPVVASEKNTVHLVEA